MGTKYPELFNALAADFPPDCVRQLDKKGTRIDYITARSVMNRLDDILGPENWTATYHPGSSDSLFCHLTITLPDGTKLTKIDAGGGAGMKDAGDDDKSMVSDAFKRAAVLFGIGRSLYGDGQVIHTAGASFPAVPAPPPAAIHTVRKILSGDGSAGVISGRDLGFWAADNGKEAGYDLLSYLKQWADKREISRPMAEWTTDEVARGLAACRSRLEKVRQATPAR